MDVPTEWAIVRLDKTHDRTQFSCGKASLDAFLRSQAMPYEKRYLARTYVATTSTSARVAGYYTLASGALDVASLPEGQRRKLPRHPIPTIHLARLAVDEHQRGRRLGETLLFHALALALRHSEEVGVFGVDVWALDDEAARFYRKYSFTSLDDDSFHLLLQTKTLEAMFAS